MNGYPRGAIWPASDEDSVQIREVYSRYGLAMYRAQVLEHGMVNAVIVARMLPKMRDHSDRSAWEDAFDRAYDVAWQTVIKKAPESGPKLRQLAGN